jgi:hypothetical protein
MHNDQSFDDIIRECRLDPDEFNDIFFRNAEYPSSGQRSAYQFSDYGDQIGEYMHLILISITSIIIKSLEDSSPSPPERYSESRLVPYAHRPVSRYEENGRNQQLLSNAFVLRSHGRELDARTGSTSYGELGTVMDKVDYKVPTSLLILGFDSTNTNYNPRTPNVPQIRGHQFQAPSRYGNSVPVGQRTQFQASEPQSTYSRSSISCDSHGIRLRPVSELR